MSRVDHDETVRFISLRKLDRYKIAAQFDSAPGQDRSVDDQDRAGWVPVHGGGIVVARAALALMRKPGERGPQRAPTKRPVTIRLDGRVLDYWKATGPGWQSRINQPC